MDLKLTCSVCCNEVHKQLLAKTFEIYSIRESEFTLCVDNCSGSHQLGQAQATDKKLFQILSPEVDSYKVIFKIGNYEYVGTHCYVDFPIVVNDLCISIKPRKFSPPTLQSLSTVQYARSVVQKSFPNFQFYHIDLQNSLKWQRKCIPTYMGIEVSVKQLFWCEDNTYFGVKRLKHTDSYGSLYEVLEYLDAWINTLRNTYEDDELKLRSFDLEFPLCQRCRHNNCICCFEVL